MKHLYSTLFVFLSFGLFSQPIVLTPSANPLTSCTNVMPGTTLMFSAVKSDCSNEIILQDASMAVLLTLNVGGADTTFSYTFEEAGTFTFFCGAAPTAVAMNAVCVDVEAIPTMSEWGLIMLMLFLLNVGIVAIRQTHYSASII